MADSKKRCPKFNDEEIDALICGVEKHKEILTSKFSNTVTAEAKTKCWENIAAMVNSVRHDTIRTREKVEEKYSYLKVIINISYSNTLFPLFLT